MFHGNGIGDAECTATKPTSSCKISARRAATVGCGSGHERFCVCVRISVQIACRAST